MGSRSGDVDPGLHQYLADTCGWSLDEVTRKLNRESGLLGLSGLSNDMRTLRENVRAGSTQARLAIDVFVYRLAKTLAGLMVAVGHVDGLIFTGGIGENDAETRAAVCELLAFCGFRLDPQKNQSRAKPPGHLISPDSCQPRVLVIPTNEERMIARESRMVLQAASLS
jgi:acetate kinase